MLESELAFNANGERFSLPDTATDWRVRRLRGAPELVYGRDGSPLLIPIEDGMDELCEAVTTSGRLRLDAVDADGKIIEGVPPAYVQVTIPPRNSSMPEAAPTTLALTSTDHVVRELAQANADFRAGAHVGFWCGVSGAEGAARHLIGDA